MKTVLYDRHLQVTASASAGYPTQYPAASWAEQNPESWWKAFIKSAKQVLSVLSPSQIREIKVIAIDGMSPTVVALDSTGKVLRNAIIWMDNRSVGESEELGATIGSEIREICGNRNDSTNFSPKLCWIRDNEPEVYEKTHRFLSSHGYLVFRLTGKYSMDGTQCGLSQLCDTRKREWSDTLITGSGLDREKLPPIFQSKDVVGLLRKDIASLLGLPANVQVIAGAMDNVSAGLGSGVMNDSELYISAGTATNVCICASQPQFNTDFHVYEHIVPGKWIHTGGVDYGGAGFKWFTALIGEKDYAAFDSQVEKTSPHQHPLVFLPYMVGQRAPLWNTDTRACIFGLEPSISPVRLGRAIMEGNALGVRKILAGLNHFGVYPVSGRFTGGCSKSQVYSQIFADVLGLTLMRMGEMDSAGRGMAMAGAVAAGFYDNFQEMQDYIPVTSQVEPHVELNQYYSRVFELFDRLYEKLKPEFAELARLRIPR